VTEPVVRTDRGWVRGVQRPGSSAFLGIPFAAPPVGRHRFLPPAPHPAWDGVRPADRHGATPQRRSFFDDPLIPEPSIPGDSTLNVDVFTPAAGETDARLPVLVWIHGGRYFTGSPASPWWDGASFNRDGVVTVTVSYRLGFDGFGWVPGGGLNRGLLDQIAALEWVQRNIRQFGGDPDRVTLAGQSAGGGAVQALLVSPRARGLFRAAISHSGAAGPVTADRVIPVATAFASSLGIEPTLDGWRSVEESVIDARQRAFNSVGDSMIDPVDGSLRGGAGALDLGDLGDLVAQARSGRAGATGFAWAPTVDGDVLPRDIETAIRDGDGGDIALLIGATRNEFAFPSDLSPEQVAEWWSELGISRAGVTAWSAELDRIGSSNARSQLLTDVLYRASVPRVVAFRASSGSAARTWAFDFAGAPPGMPSTHCLDLPFAWDALEAPGVARALGPEPSHALAASMHADWVRFVERGVADWADASSGVTGARSYRPDGVVDDPTAYLLEAEIGGVA